jgi:lysozyme family protein
MPLSVAQDIYDKHYWDPQRCDDLPAGLDYSMFDYGVNSGIGRSGKVLRRLLGLPDNTSAITQEVIDAVNKRDPKALIAALNDERLRFLKSLKTWPTFGGGWGRRVAEVKALSLKMAGAPLAPVLTPTNNNEVMAKGLAGSQVKHEATKGNVAKGGAVVSVSGGGFGGWLGAHPGYAALGVGAGVMCTIAAVELLEHRFKARQEAPTPGLIPVPVAVAA